MPQTEIQEWLAIAPESAKLWLKSTALYRFICDEQRKSFNAPGRYDGAMGEDCKALIRAEYKTLTEIREWLESPATSPVVICPGCKSALYDAAAVRGWCVDCDPLEKPNP